MPDGQRVAVLVDVSNLYHSVRMQHQARICYDKFLEGLGNGRQIIRSIAYIIHRPDVTQAAFLDALSRFGFDLRTKELKMRTGQDGSMIPVRTSWEVGLTLDAVTIADKVDVVILASGDKCYLPLVHFLKMRGCRVEISGFDHSTSGDLIKNADKFIPIRKEWMMAQRDNVPQDEEDEEDEPQPLSYESRLVFDRK